MVTLQQLIDACLDTVQDASFAEAGTAAQGTITVAGLPSAGESLVVHDTFVFADTREVAFEIAIGADADGTAANIALAINTDLSVVSASATDGAVTVTAASAGSQGNRIPFSSSATNVEMNGSGFLGGTTAGVNGDRVRTYLNDGLSEISSRLFLPDLETSDQVTTSADGSYVDLPTDFQKKLFRAWSDTRSIQVTVFSSVALLYRNLPRPDLGGSVMGMAVRGKRLYYARRGAETITIHYYRQPTALVALGDTPDCLPDDLARKLLESYACMQMFSRIEDGIEGRKVNTEWHEAKFEQAMAALTLFLGPPAFEPREFVDDLNLGALMGNGGVWSPEI